MPFGPPETIAKALTELLASRAPGKAGGFVIFENESGDFVQFSIEPDGLCLFWPAVSSIGPDRVTPILTGIPHEVADDGVYANFGRDVERVTEFTMRAFREIFGREPQKLKAQIELE